MLWRMKYVSPDGKDWPVINETHRGVFIEEAGLGALRGRSVESVFQRVGRDGQVPRLNGRLVGFDTTLNFVVCAQGGRTTGEVLVEWLRAWPFGKPGRLVLSSDVSGELSIPVRLSMDAELKSWDYQPDEAGVLNLPMPLVFDSGAWEQETALPGPTVTVTNWGDGLISPVLEWNGAGGVVTTPAGATFTLPAVPSPRFMVLDNAESYHVTDAAGKRDDALWLSLRGVVSAAPVPPGKKAVWKLPAGAKLHWTVKVVNPWR